MNKVVSVNLNGFIFTIDEEAYEILKQYLDSLGKHFHGQEGGPEIISDIETRIAELLQQGLTSANPVVQINDVKRVISLMGEPWQFEEASSENKEQASENTSYSNINEPQKLRRDENNKIIGGVCGAIGNYLKVDPIVFRLLFAVSFFVFGTGLLLYVILWIAIPKAKAGELKSTTQNKKMFRDEDDKIIGGVCSGLGHYFGVDPVWFRIGFLISFFFFGSGLLLYILLWIAIPKAVTASEKLQMKGRPVDINNIENLIKDSFPKSGDKLNRAGSLLTELLKNIMRIMGKFIGFIFSTIGIVLLILILMLVFNHKDLNIINSISDIVLDSQIMSYSKIGTSLIIGSIGAILVLIGAKLLFQFKFKTRALYLLFVVAFTIGCVFEVVSIGKLVYKFHEQSSYTNKVEMSECPDTLILNTNILDTFSDNKKMNFSLNENKQFGVQYSSDNGFFSVQDQSLTLEPSFDKKFNVEIKKSARGASQAEAMTTAKNSKYGYAINKNTFTFDNCMVFNKENPYYFQSADITMHLPVGTIIQVNEQINDMLIYGKSDATIGCESYIMTSKGITCLVATETNDESNDDNDGADEVSININTGDEKNDSVSIQINSKKEDGVQSKKTIIVKDGKKITTNESVIGPIKINSREVETTK